MKNSKQMK